MKLVGVVPIALVALGLAQGAAAGGHVVYKQIPMSAAYRTAGSTPPIYYKSNPYDAHVRASATRAGAAVAQMGYGAYRKDPKAVAVGAFRSGFYGAQATDYLYRRSRATTTVTVGVYR